MTYHVHGRRQVARRQIRLLEHGSTRRRVRLRVRNEWMKGARRCQRGRDGLASSTARGREGRSWRRARWRPGRTWEMFIGMNELDMSPTLGSWYPVAWGIRGVEAPPQPVC